MPGLQHSAKETMPRARPMHSATFPLCRVPAGGTRQRVSFAECQVEALSKDLTPSAPLTGGARQARVLGTCAGFAECRLASTRQRWRVAECCYLPTAGTRQIPDMLCAAFLPSTRGLALGKPHLCRVPVVWHSAKASTLGKYSFSGSVRTNKLEWIHVNNQYISSLTFPTYKIHVRGLYVLLNGGSIPSFMIEHVMGLLLEE